MNEKYDPNMANLMREADPAKRREDRRKALENAGRPTPAGFFRPAEHDVEDAEAEGAEENAETHVSAPSPWAAEGVSAEVDKAVLPSTMMPAVGAAAEERPVTKAAAPVNVVRRRWPGTWIVVLGCIGVGLTAMLAAVLVMLGRATPSSGKAAVMPSVTAVPSVTAAPSVTAVPSVTATMVPSAVPVPSVTAAPSAHARTVASAKPHDKTNEPSAEMPDAGAPRVEEPPRPSPTVFVNGAKPEF